MLEDFEDGQDVLVKLRNNDEYLLYDFEMVDESIYDCDDVVMATISSVIKSDFCYKNGTKIELSINDIVELKDPCNEFQYFSG
ncbi:hypothetical protein [Bathymodiolus japonicus methanotrophic gill symbiont]|uniref:hypothetical protein n=1 Tax=Bathymodiolus japonicus methanotrophic gill symbiont TaxID=113269 RepID=UPI001C8E4357|nr:hypothetical protein [Bathymodiolus japonicus methanotrophic gill symbiont]